MYLDAFDQQSIVQMDRIECNISQLRRVSLIDVDHGGLSSSISALKDLLGNLYMTSADNRIKELWKLKQFLPEYEYDVRKQHIIKALTVR